MQNNCSNKRNYLQSLFVLLLFIFLPLGNTYASYTSVSLLPASGTITTAGTNINVAVNTGNDNFIGVDVTIEYTGQVEYVTSSVVKSSGCGDLNIVNTPGTGTNGGGRIDVMCAYTGAEKKYSGNVATLKFKAKATSGTSKFTITRAPTVSHGTNLLGANYTLAASTNTTGTTGGDNNNDNTGTGGMGGGSSLPQSGIFDNVSQKVVIGSSLILMGILFAVIPAVFPKISLFVKNTHTAVSNSISSTIRTVLTKQKEKSEKRRRGKLEKKF